MEWISIDLSPKLSFTCGGNVNYYKSVYHSIPTLPVGIGTSWQMSRQISKLSFQLNAQIYSLLGQTEGERKAFLDGARRGGRIVRLPPKTLGCHKR